MKALDDEHAGRRRSAAFAIAHLGEEAEAAVPHLVTLLGDRDPDVVWNAAQALGHIGLATEEVAKGLITALEHSDNGVTAKAAEALAAIGGDAAEDAAGVIIGIALASEDDSVRSVLLESLVGVGMNEDEAKRLGTAEVPEDSVTGPQIFGALLQYPDLALAFLEKHPWTLSKCPRPSIRDPTKRPAPPRSNGMGRRSGVLADP